MLTYLRDSTHRRRCPGKLRGRSRLQITINLHEGLARNVVRMLGSFNEVQHGRKTDVGTFK